MLYINRLFLKTYCKHEKNLNNFISLVLIAGFIGLSTTQANSEDINDPLKTLIERFLISTIHLMIIFSNLLPRLGVKSLISQENHYQT